MGCLAPTLFVSRYEIFMCGVRALCLNGTFFRPTRTHVTLRRLACACAGTRPIQGASMLKDMFLPSRIVLSVLTLRGFREMCKSRFVLKKIPFLV
jgi:hypothetical protein